MHTQNYNTFKNTLASHYSNLFDTNPEYKLVKSKHTPIGLADLITDRLMHGCADKDGDGIKLTCKELKIKHTYKAIEEYLKG